MGKVDLSALTKDEALMYVWADTYTIQSFVELLRLQGFNFESVYQICDVATYPAQEAKLSKPALEGCKGSVAEMMVDGAPPTTPDNAKTPETSETSTDVTPMKTTTKRAKKQRCPPLALPSTGRMSSPRVLHARLTSSACLGAKVVAMLSTSS